MVTIRVATGVSTAGGSGIGATGGKAAMGQDGCLAQIVDADTVDHQKSRAPLGFRWFCGRTSCQLSCKSSITSRRSRLGAASLQPTPDSRQ